MDYIIIGAAATFIIALLSITVLPLIKAYLKSSSADSDENKKEGTKGSTPAISPPPVCPVCRSPLPKGVDLRTKVFRPMNVHDQHCIIFGCPSCYPVPKEGIDRRCPVCHASVPIDGHLVARLFNKTGSKKHLAVTGCPHCAKY